MSKYEILEESHETAVFCDDKLIAIFFGGEHDRYRRAHRFVSNEERLEEVEANLRACLVETLREIWRPEER